MFPNKKKNLVFHFRHLFVQFSIEYGQKKFALSANSELKLGITVLGWF